MLLLLASIPAAALDEATAAPQLEQVAWLEDPSGVLGPAQVALLPDDQLLPLDGTVGAGFSRCPRWIRFQLANPGALEEQVDLAFRFPLVERLDLYLAAPGGFEHQPGGLAVPEEQRGLIYQSGTHVRRLALAPGERRLGLLRVETRGAGFLGLELHRSREQRRQGAVGLLVQAGLGALVALLLVYASYSLVGRRRMDLEALAFLACQAIHVAIASGAVSALWPLPPGPLVVAKAAAAAGSAFAGAWFIRSFLRTSSRRPALDRVLAAAGVCALGSIAALPFSMVGGNVLITLVGLLSLVVCTVATAEAWLAGLPAVRSLLPGVAVFAVSTGWYLLSLLGLAPPSPLVVLAEAGGAALIAGTIPVAVVLQDWSAAGQREGRLETLVAERTATLSRAVEALRAEASERHSAEARFRLAFETYPDSVSINRLEDGVFVAVNQGFLEMHSATSEQVLGRSAEELGVWAAGGRDQFRDRLRREGAIREHEMRLRAPSGTERALLLDSSLLRLDGVDHVLTVARDVTGARVAEATRARLEGQLRQAQKLEAVGRLAAGVAHDFNNLLTVLSVNVELMLDGLPEDHPNHVYQQEARDTVGRATALTRQLLAFTRRQAAAPRPVAVDELVRGMERLLGRLVGDDIRLEFRLAGELPPVRADPAQLEQVLLNLVVNARDAVRPGGHILVETGLAEPPSPEGRPTPHVRIAVRDDGAGMDEETRQHVFEPFFTTKADGKGTGLGLATVYGVVRQHGGTVAVQSAPGRGALFEVFLPVLAGQSGLRTGARPGAVAVGLDPG